MDIRFEKLISRSTGRLLAHQLELAGIKLSVDQLAGILVIGSLSVFIATAVVLYNLKYSPLIYAPGSIGAAALFIVVIYLTIEYRIDQRGTKMETLLPDFLQVVAANLSSGIALDKALMLAARPEFGSFADDVKELGRGVYSGETLENAFSFLVSKYRSDTLRNTVRMMMEAMRYGSPMADLTEKISRDLRQQQLIQKEVNSQVFMYVMFITFAGLIASPVLFGLTSNMIRITDQVWQGILAQNPHGIPSTGGLLTPSPPKITPQEYNTFSYLATIIITGFAALIITSISSGSIIKGVRLMPVFIIVGLVIFIIVQHIVASLFANLGAV